RFSHFDPSRPSPRIAFEHPILDRRITPGTKVIVLSDEEIDQLVEDFVRAARQARELGFDFVDIKHSHGYLLHELLGAHTRAGRYGGSFENRTRFLRNVVTGVRREAPGLEIGVRVSAFDLVPFRPDPALTRGRELGPGIPEDFSKLLPYRYGFGVSESNPTEMDLDETERFLALLRELGIRLVNISGGSPYYNPHCQRPALYPPSDGYRPPEDPLAGVARHLAVTRDLARKSPDLVLVGSGLSYLQDYFPHVAQAAVRAGWMSSAGLGRMVLSYPDLPADCLEKGKLERKKICRTFSDCTTAPRHGLVSGCYPLDPAYRDRPEATVLRDVKRDGGRADPSASSETKGMRD
ncbi:MAG TPA: NADH:flavin oxidoreductase, partial [Planctomycetota bacterium]|nr:NADH:flavin oxidoreductase [Planctomycetota bacterium]